ncbi:MAG: radical SAM protein [bacterium]
MKKPILLQYFITYNCNAECLFCDIPQKLKSAKNSYAQPPEVYANLREARKIGCKFVDFTGGEPLLHKHLPEFLKQAKQFKYITSVTTNGILFPALYRELDGLIDLFHISLDAGTGDMHDRIRGKQSFDKVMESLEICRDLKLKPDILFTYMRDNYGELDAVIKIAQKYGRVLIVNPVFCYSGKKENNCSINDFISNYINRKYVYINRAFLHLNRNGGNNIKNPRCKAASAVIALSPDNELLMPCFHKCVEKIPVNRRLSEIIAEERYYRLREMEGRYDFCQGCTINCYMDPSFHYKKDFYTILSIRSKLKYVWDKYIFPGA